MFLLWWPPSSACPLSLCVQVQYMVHSLPMLRSTRSESSSLALIDGLMRKYPFRSKRHSTQSCCCANPLANYRLCWSGFHLLFNYHALDQHLACKSRSRSSPDDAGSPHIRPDWINFLHLRLGSPDSVLDEWR